MKIRLRPNRLSKAMLAIGRAISDGFIAGMELSKAGQGLTEEGIKDFKNKLLGYPVEWYNGTTKWDVIARLEYLQRQVDNMEEKYIKVKQKYEEADSRLIKRINFESELEDILTDNDFYVDGNIIEIVTRLAEADYEKRLNEYERSNRYPEPENGAIRRRVCLVCKGETNHVMVDGDWLCFNCNKLKKKVEE